MRQTRGQPEIARCTRSVASPNANAGSSSITATPITTGVTFDITLSYLGVITGDIGAADRHLGVNILYGSQIAMNLEQIVVNRSNDRN